LKTLDDWTLTTRRYTELAYDQFFLPNPGEFEHSEPLFRMLSLVTCLQRHCGVRYDYAKAGLPVEAKFDLDESFIHGVT
jgi:hypothetical protein